MSCACGCGLEVSHGHLYRRGHYPRTKIDVEVRFWRYVTVGNKDECWLWQGACDTHGYGAISDGNGNRTSAHRVAYKIGNGTIDDSLDVLHSCDNPPCCNYHHLFQGTHLTNMQDMAMKGRADRRHGRKGEAHHNAQLTEDDVLYIRNPNNIHLSNNDLALILDVTRDCVYDARNFRSWKHV